MHRGRSLLGVVLIGVTGVVFGHAWTAEGEELWWLGALTFLSGVLFLLSSGLLSAATAEEVALVIRPRGSPEGDGVHRLLGRLMVDRYQFITEGQLKEALARQRGTTRRLGEILLDMGLITVLDLRRVLEDQRLGSYLWHPMDRPDETGLAKRGALGGTIH